MLLNPNEQVRLRRMMPGTNTDDLIEELVSMAGDTQPQQFPHGIDLTPSSLKNPPPVQIQYPADGSTPTLLKINRGGFSLSLNLNPDGTLSLDSSENGKSTPAAATVSSGGNCFPGRVDSYVGANVYNVTVFKTGIGGAGVSVQATQLEGDPAFPHTADGTRWTLVTQTGAQYTMQMPTWE